MMIQKMRKFGGLLLGVELVISTFSGCAHINERVGGHSGISDDVLAKCAYIISFGFDTYPNWLAWSADLPSYTQVVFTDQKPASVTAYPVNVIVAWPSPRTEAKVVKMNYVIDVDNHDVYPQNDLDLAKFNLTYPLTLADMLNQPLDVKALYDSLDDLDRILVNHA